MDAHNRDSRTQANRSTGQDGDADGSTRAADDLAGRTELNSSPPTRSIEDNPVVQASRDAGDLLADEVRDGEWRAPEEKHDDRRGR